MKLRYFAWVRERVGHGEERVELPATVATVADLIGWLKTRGPGYEAAFAEPGVIRAAIDMIHVDHSAPVPADAEVAFFPPVTGG